MTGTDHNVGGAKTRLPAALRQPFRLDLAPNAFLRAGQPRAQSTSHFVQAAALRRLVRSRGSFERLHSRAANPITDLNTVIDVDTKFSEASPQVRSSCASLNSEDLEELGKDFADHDDILNRRKKRMKHVGETQSPLHHPGPLPKDQGDGHLHQHRHHHHNQALSALRKSQAHTGRLLGSSLEPSSYGPTSSTSTTAFASVPSVSSINHQLKRAFLS